MSYATGPTLMQLRRRVRARIGVPLSDQFQSDDVIDDHVNLAMETIASEHYWPWDEQLGTATVDVTTGELVMPSAISETARAVRSVFVDGMEVRSVASSDLLRYDTASAGPPQMWAEIGDKLYVRPVPDSPMDVTVVWYMTSAPLAEDADRARIPGQYEGAIIAKTAELLSLREDLQSAADRHGTDYAQWVTRMRRNMRRSTKPAVPRVREGSWI